MTETTYPVTLRLDIDQLELLIDAAIARGKTSAELAEEWISENLSNIKKAARDCSHEAAQRK